MAHHKMFMIQESCLSVLSNPNYDYIMTALVKLYTDEGRIQYRTTPAASGEAT